MQPLRSRFVAGLFVGVLLVLGSTAFIRKTSVADYIVAPLVQPDDSGSADIVVVLGAGITGDCGLNHNALRRVLLAVRLWREQPSAVVLITGGTEGPCPVAAVMADFARELGVPSNKLSTETASTSTFENAERSAPLLRGWGMDELLLVTDRLHMSRAKAVFEHFGFKVKRAAVPIHEGHEDNLSMLVAGLREYVALAYYKARGWLEPVETNRHAYKVQVQAPGVPHERSKGQGPMVVLGASYAAGWTLHRVGGIELVNKGVGGELWADLLERFDRDVVALAPRAVIIWAGINDLFRSDPEATARTLALVHQGYLSAIRRACANGIEPILATEPTLALPSRSLRERIANRLGTLVGKDSYQDRMNRQIIALNDWIRETGRRENLLVLDLEQVLAESSGRRNPFFAQPDGSHISPAGYDALTTYARPVLVSHLAAE